MSQVLWYLDLAQLLIAQQPVSPPSYPLSQIRSLILCTIIITGNTEDKSVPTLVQGLAGHKIVGVELGSGDAHTLALEDSGEYTVSVWLIKFESSRGHTYVMEITFWIPLFCTLCC